MSKKEKMIASILFVLFAGSFMIIRAKPVHQDEESIPTLTVCEALSHAARYDGKIVRIRDRVVGTSESTSFLGEACPGIFVTDGKVWPSAIAWTMPTATSSIIHNVNFSFDWESGEKWNKKWSKLNKQFSDQCIAATFTGMFEIWSPSAARKLDSKGNQYELLGFGHLNEKPAQLVLKSADDVIPIPNCKAKK